MTRRGLIGVLAGGAGLLLSGCASLLGTTARLRYRITITCDTPDGIKSGSAVQEVMRYDPIEAIKPVNIGTTERTGDAVVIVVGGNHYFVGLITCGALLLDAIQIGQVQPPSAKIAGNGAKVLKRFKDANGRAELDGAKYMSLPSRRFGLTSFADEQDYSTIKTIKLREDLGSWTLKSVSVTVTQEPITRQATEILPWLRTLTGSDIRKHPKYDGYLDSKLANLSDRFGVN